MAEVPKDFFNDGGELHYRRQDQGYVLYSVGVNKKDDGGRGYDEYNPAGKQCDDIVVRVPKDK